MPTLSLAELHQFPYQYQSLARHSDPGAFLLPYWMARYHGLLAGGA